ncbi:hypothetical protein OSB04_005902 [Centaurea solstitialis]|uniref:Uncharacterized protein n=1 Tax=Centaurea solstitialis TaxID=347529 RepID=A0AA38U021_9ASTR|nr:hypothetical protein OSB04_005902 [Centaurea solstitialis]
MESPTLKIISDSFIKPKTISQEAKKPIYFSSWDLPLFSVNYIQKGLLFRSPENQDFSIATFLQDLKDSLSVTLTHFHPLAARIATIKQQNPPSLTAFLDLENSPGARFIHSTVDLKVSDVLQPTDVPLIVQSFFDHHQAIAHDGHKLSLLSVQVTELIDGIFIGVSVNHMVADGTSYWHFFNSWSEVFQSKARNGYFAPVSRPPILERWVPSGSDPIATLPFINDDNLIDRHIRPFLRERIFHFSSDSLSNLKSKANSERNTTKISTLQALSAIVWRCVTRSRRLPENQETGCRLAINNRGRISPSMPETYFGNMILTVTAIATAGELAGHGVGCAAWRLHEAVAGHDDKAIMGFADWWLKNPFVFKMSEHDDPHIVHMGSSPRFDMYGNEFGLGKAVAVRSGFANKFDGKMTLYPGRDGGGSMDLEVCLLPENMAAFECDQELLSLVNGEEAI